MERGKRMSRKIFLLAFVSILLLLPVKWTGLTSLSAHPQTQDDYSASPFWPDFRILNVKREFFQGYSGTKGGLLWGERWSTSITVKNIGGDARNVEVQGYMGEGYIRFPEWPSNESKEISGGTGQEEVEFTFRVYEDSSRTILQYSQTYIVNFGEVVLSVACLPKKIVPYRQKNITIYGKLWNASNEMEISHQKVSLHVWIEDWRPLINLTTDQTGNYTYVWSPPKSIFQTFPNQIVAEVKAVYIVKQGETTYSHVGRTNVISFEEGNNDLEPQRQWLPHEAFAGAVTALILIVVLSITYILMRARRSFKQDLNHERVMFSRNLASRKSMQAKSIY